MTTTPPLPAAINLLTIFNTTPKHIPTQQPPKQQKPIRHPHKHSPSPHLFHIPSWPHSYKRPPRRFTFATKHVVTGGEIMEPNVDGFHGRWGRQPSVELQLPRHITSPVNATSSPILSFVETSSPMISPLVPLEYMEHIKLPSPMSQTIVYPSPTTTPCAESTTQSTQESSTTSTTYDSSTQSTPTTQTMTPITRKMTLPPPTTQHSPILISSSMTPAMSTPSNNGPTPKAKAPPTTPVISAQQPHQQPSPQQLPPQKPQPPKHTRTRTIPTLPPSWVTISMTPTQETSTPQPIHCLCTTSPCHHIIDIPSTYMYPSPSYSEFSSYRSTCSNSPLIPHESNRPPTHTRYPSQWHHWRVPSYCHFDSPNQKVATN